MKRLVVLDTSFLLAPFQLKIDVMRELDYLLEGEFDLVVSTGVLAELKKLSKNAGKEGAAARVGLKILDARKPAVTIVQGEGPVDDWIVEFCRKNRGIACTVDKKLAKRLKSAECRVIVVKGRSKLGFA